MTDTPETDNLARGNHVVPTEFAEQLERERDKLIASLKFHAELNKELVAERDDAIEMLKKTKDNSGQIIAIIAANNTLLGEQLDELENKLEKSKSYKNLMKRDNAELRKQLDRLAKALKYWRDISECVCSDPLPNGGCLRCDLDKILNATK